MPVIQVGPLALPVFPLAIMLGAWLGLEISARVARRLGLDGDHIYNAFFYALVAGVVVGRLAHVVAFWPAYRAQPLEIIGLNAQAFLLWPGVAAGVAAWAWYVHRRRLPWTRMLDAYAPGALVAFAVAGLGAFVAGRNPGAPTDVPWAVLQWGVERHPVQLYESGAALIAAWAAYRTAMRGPSAPEGGGGRPGSAALVALLSFGLILWLFEPFRAESATLPGGLRTAQVAGLAVALAALWLLRPRAEGSSDLQAQAKAPG